MRIRTKLVLLISAALVSTIVVSTWLRLRWTRAQMLKQLQDSARDTAAVIYTELTSELRSDMTEDDIKELLTRAELRHPSAENLVLKLEDSEEETSSTFSLGRSSAEPRIDKKPTKSKGPLRLRADALRALYDHGETMRAPGERMIEPTWRTPDKPGLDNDRWPVRATPAPKPAITITQPREGAHGPTVFEVTRRIDPPGPLQGTLTIRVSSELVDNVLRTDELISAFVLGVAMLLLVAITLLIVQRVVARPAAILEAAMQRVEGGALDARVPATARDEIGTLARVFNAMLGRLEAADHEIRAFNRRLADEVQAATLDLARKNEALGQLNRLLRETRQQLGDKERLAALGQLAAQLAHEIGTPLGSVSGHLQLALTARDVPPPLQERLRVATRELERVSKIVRDYLDSTRTVVPERARVDVARLVDEALGIALGGEARAQVQMEKQIAPEAAAIETDPGLLRQILVNLITNAADALHEHGRILVRADVDGPLLTLEVRDDGVGIAADDVARIFEPFYTTKGRGKGTGLGLAICRELAEALGGRITVDSAPGRGSTFTVRLPLVMPAQRKAS